MVEGDALVMLVVERQLLIAYYIEHTHEHEGVEECNEDDGTQLHWVAVCAEKVSAPQQVKLFESSNRPLLSHNGESLALNASEGFDLLVVDNEVLLQLVSAGSFQLVQGD